MGEQFYTITTKGRKILKSHGYQEASNDWTWVWHNFQGQKDREINFWENDKKEIDVNLVSCNDPTEEDPILLKDPKWLKDLLPLIKIETEDYQTLVKDLIKEEELKGNDWKDTILKIVLEKANKREKWEHLYSKNQEEMVEAIGFAEITEEGWWFLYIGIKEAINDKK